MRTVCYQIASTQTASAAAAAQLTILRNGRIVGLQFVVRGVGGAGTGWYDMTVDVNNTGTTFSNTNNPPREPILGGHCVTAGAAAGVASVGPFLPVNVACKPGDILSLNQVNVSNAFASIMAIARVLVEEAS